MQKSRSKLKRMDRVTMNYIMNAFEIMEKELSECKRLQALKSNKLLNDKRPRMQQDINIINEHDSDENLNVQNAFVSELKQEVEAKKALAENQRKIIENQNDKIFKLNDEKDRLQRDIKNLKQEMEMDRSRE